MEKPISKSDITKEKEVFISESARNSLKRARIIFDTNESAALFPPIDKSIHRAAIVRLIRTRYPLIPSDGVEFPKEENSSLTGKALRDLREDVIDSLRVSSNELPKPKSNKSNALMKVEKESNSSKTSTKLVVHREVDKESGGVVALAGQRISDSDDDKNRILTKKSASHSIPTPKWHAPWKLHTVLSSHLGWVRSIAFDPVTNDMFATGGADRVIKIFDLAKACVGAEDALKITLTGHVSPIRGLAFSPRHPYLFSAGEDKMVKCWDLETNQVVRHYHGHLSGVFCLKLHPTLDVLVTGGRDAVARVWDMRTKLQVHVLSGHDNTIGSILTKSTDPQIITGSYDSTIKLWDLAAGKSLTTLTHHKKAIRALVQPTYENTFLSGAADTLKKWHGRTGQFVKNFTGHDKAIINALAINDDGVVLSGADNGSMHFWDYSSGYCFQQTETVVQPGSLDAENAIFAAEFDLTGTRLITGEADKSIKIWTRDENASEISHPIDMVGWRKKFLAEAKYRY